MCPDYSAQMRYARRQTMEAWYKRRKSSLSEEGVKILNKVQVPQLGGLSRDVRTHTHRHSALYC